LSHISNQNDSAHSWSDLHENKPYKILWDFLQKPTSRNNGLQSLSHAYFESMCK